MVVTLRGASSVPFMLLPLILTGNLAALKPVRIGMHAVRGVLMLFVLVLVARVNRRLLLGLATWVVPQLGVTVLFKLEGQHDHWFVASWLKRAASSSGSTLSVGM